MTDVGASSSQESNITPQNQRILSARSHRSIVHPEGSLREESEMVISGWDGPVAVRRKCFHPARRIILIEYHMIKQIVYGAAGLFCRPVALAFGNIFANIRIHRSQGEKVPEEQLLIV
ncbi:unnamed protein product, partial [Mesorhabditis belari]|uniref:Uncharacterized protein n=1 Tax=Mesorhabditis belari TaxID=2138241 RepID=A0AAF3J9I2_9BILA